jgi:sugar lactone lactonase YvrE
VRDAPKEKNAGEDDVIKRTTLMFAIGLALPGCMTAPPAPPESELGPALEVVGALPNAPGNITVTPSGLVVTSVHPSFDSDVVAYAAAGGEVEVFPEGAAGGVAVGDAPGTRRVLSVRADRDRQVWMLAGMPGPGPKIFYIWDLDARAMARTIEVATGEGAIPSSFFNDMALALDHGVVVVSDPAADGPALLVLDAETGSVRRLLENHASVVAEDVDGVIDGVPLAQARDAAGALIPLRGAVNPITIDADEEWVYYGPMSGLSLYRVRLADLMDESLSAEQLGARVERFGDKPASAGITIDDAGNVYVTDVGARGVGVTAPDGRYRLLVQDDVLLDWPDGLAVGDDGYVYVAANGLYRTWLSHEALGRPEPPFPLVRFKALAPSTAGR